MFRYDSLVCPPTGASKHLRQLVLMERRVIPALQNHRVPDCRDRGICAIDLGEIAGEP